MSHRTRHLPPTHPVLSFIRELRYHEASRQLLAIGLIALFAAFGRPVMAWLFWAGVVMLTLGVLVRLWASGHVKKNKQLATNGPYALVRHPLYVGNILMLVGFATAGQVWWMLPLTVLFIWFYYPPAVDYEDRKLHRLFGQAWEQWRETTRALLPSRPRGAGLGGKWSFKQSLVGNGEPVIVAFAAFCFFVLFTRL